MWLDLETTGVHQTCAVLEVGAVLTVTCAEGCWRVREVTDFHSLVDPFADRDLPLVSALRAQCRPVVRDMHDRNGLWDELKAPKAPLPGAAQVAAELGRLVHSLVPAGQSMPVRLAGSGVAAFDWRILSTRPEWYPFTSQVVHGVIDVGVLRRAAAAMGLPPTPPDQESLSTVEHRALPDAYRALREWEAIGERWRKWSGVAECGCQR